MKRTRDLARRIVYTEDRRGEWRYRVQAANWRTIDLTEEGLSLSDCRARVRSRWPKTRQHPACDVVKVPYGERGQR